MTNTEIIAKLDEYMHKFVTEELTNLNASVIKQTASLGHYESTEIYVSDSGWTHASGEDVFELAKPVAGMIKTVRIPAPTHVKRILLGYMKSTRLAESGDYTQFKHAIYPMVIQTLIELEKILGFGSQVWSTGQTYLTFERPNQPGKYFLDMESHAAFELRGFSSCVATNVIKEVKQEGVNENP